MQVEPSEPGGLGEAVADVVEAEPAIRWGVMLRPGDGSGPHTVAADEPMAIASVGKTLLLFAVAESIEAGGLDPSEPLSRSADDAVADSGVWQHLDAPALSVADLAALVGAVSDNLATNVLLRRVGLEAVDRSAGRLGLRQTRVSDRVRDTRGPGDPPVFSVGTAAELGRLFDLLRAGGDPPGAAVAARVNGWLRLNADLSMVGSAFGLDPLARVVPDSGIDLVGKTGTDAAVRAEAGHVTGPSGSVAYAVIANWDDRADLHEPALAGMHRIGAAIRGHVG